MRKTSDIAMLLGSRGKSRSRGSRGARKGFLPSLLGVVDGLLGRARKGGRKKRGPSVPMFLFTVGLLAAFGGGFLLGDRLNGGEGENPLRARVGVQPGFIHEHDTTKLADEGFVVTAFAVSERRTEEEARQRASDLAKYLQDQGLAKARPREFRPGVWVTVVYFDGDAEHDGTRDELLNLPEEVPCVEFRQYRAESQWPQVYDIK